MEFIPPSMQNMLFMDITTKTFREQVSETLGVAYLSGEHFAQPRGHGKVDPRGL
jgi:hypothetical protein